MAQSVEADEAMSIPHWTWNDVKSLVERVVQDHLASSLQSFVQKAKECSDHLRQVTSNKTWKANWLRRVADMLAHVRVKWDHSNIQVLSKLFLVEWETPLPRSRGVCFQDVYLDIEWAVQPKSPSNDCYMFVRYPFFYEVLADDASQLDIDSFKEKLRLFLESLYFANEHVFQIKLAFLHAAFKKVCTSKMIFEIGKGGDGKGMEAYLERGLLGEEQSATLYERRSKKRHMATLCVCSMTICFSIFFLKFLSQQIM